MTRLPPSDKFQRIRTLRKCARFVGAFLPQPLRWIGPCRHLHSLVPLLVKTGNITSRQIVNPLWYEVYRNGLPSEALLRRFYADSPLTRLDCHFIVNGEWRRGGWLARAAQRLQPVTPIS
jgi:hypothetical protein